MKRITKVKCITPFTRLSVREYGDFYTCCPSWTKLGKIGTWTDNSSLQDIWNGQRIQYIRRAILEDNLNHICDTRHCPFAINPADLDLEALKNGDRNFNWIIDQIIQGKTSLDTPPYTFEIAHSSECNLYCSMCQPRWQQDDESISEMIFTQLLPGLLPGLSRLILTAQGEALYNPYIKFFLKLLDAKKYPALRIQLLTNGTLLTPELWATINHNHYDSITVAVDAASQATYEKIHEQGDWNTLRRNLDFIAKLRRTGVFTNFNLSFTVMRSNYKELKAFAALGLALGCDHIFFQKVIGLADIRENINFFNEKKIYAEIADILRDPVFSRREVDTTLIAAYRPRAGAAGYTGIFFLADPGRLVVTFMLRLLRFVLRKLPYWTRISERLHNLCRRKELRWKFRLGVNGVKKLNFNPD